MTFRSIAVVLALSLAGLNSGAQTNNPEPAEPAPAIETRDPIQSPGPRKLSRSERRERVKNLPEKYRDFLRDVEPIILDEEVVTLLILESDAQRDLYIEQFWQRRDEDPVTAHNEFREQYLLRLEEAKAEFKHLASDRSRIFLIHGRPLSRLETECDKYLVPLEIWRYASERRFGSDYYLIFFKARLGGDFRLFQPQGRGFDALRELLSYDGERLGAANVFYGQRGNPSPVSMECRDGDQIQRALGWVEQNAFEVLKMFEPPKIEIEDIGKILRSVVLSNPDAPQIAAGLEVRYPGKRGARTSTELVLAIEKSQLRVKDLEGSRFYNVDVTGEVLKNDKLFENFRYRYDFPADAEGDSVNVVIERFLRPADYKARLKVVDVNSGGETILEKELDVPYIREAEARRLSQVEGEETVDRLFQEFRTGESQLRIVPLGSDILTGLQQIETLVTGDRIAAVEFYLDNTKVMTKRRPPYTLDLDFGEVPRQRRVKAIGLDEKGEFVTGDELAVNTGSDPFRVWIQQPRVAMNVRGDVRVEVDASAPEGKNIERVEIWLNEARLATLYERPYIQTIRVPEDTAIGYLRAVAFIDDPQMQPAEDVVFINTPDFLEEIDVHLVELPTTVLRDGKPVHDLPQSAFRVLDEGDAVEISKFEHVKQLSLSVGLAVDASGSMQPRMDEAQKAGAQFFKNALRPGDKAFVVAFDSQAYTVQKWSQNLADLHAGLSSLRAEESTALYDALVYALYHFQGVRGQKALVLISDGKDTASKFSFDQALEYSRRAAVPIYAVGIGIRPTEMDVRYKLNQLAKETGGNSYFIETSNGLDQIYTDIENELRSQYVLGFYPPGTVKPGSDWREVEVKVENGTAKTIRGYYP